jgi:hypothetical protein
MNTSIARHPKRAILTLIVLGLLSAWTARAQTTGWNQTVSATYDYNDPGNWVGGSINGVWDPALILGGDQTITFGADTSVGYALNFTYDSGGNITLRGTGANRTLTLGGDIRLATGTNRTITFGTTTANQNLNVDLGGVTRTFSATSNRTLGFVNVISNGGIITNGGQINLSGANTYSGTTTLSSGNLSLNGAAGSAVNSDITVNGGGASTSTLQINSSGSSSSGTTRAKSVTINGSGSTPGAFLTLTGNSGANSLDTITNGLTASGGLVTVGVSANGSRAAQLTAATFTRSAATTVLFRGSDLGLSTIGSLTAGDANIFFGSAPTLTGGGGAANTSTISIIKGAMLDTTSGGFGATGGYATYDATYGVRR